MNNKFWYIIGFNYEVIVFSDLSEAQKVYKERFEPEVSDYYQIREGTYGQEFSGWIGGNTDPVITDNRSY